MLGGQPDVSFLEFLVAQVNIKWPWISFEAAHSQREISTFFKSFQVYLVFQSFSHVGAKEAAVMKAGNKVLGVRRESHEKNQNGVLRIGSELFRV